MKLSHTLLTILFLLNCSFAFAGTGSAQDGYSIIFVLVGILILIFGTPRLIKNLKKIGLIIKQKFERLLHSVNQDKLYMFFQVNFKPSSQTPGRSGWYCKY